VIDPGQLIELQPLESTLGQRGIDDLVRRMATPSETPEDLEATVLLFFSLTAGDVEAVTAGLRARAIEDTYIPERERAFLRSQSADLDTLAKRLNEASMHEHGIPFQLALARSLRVPVDEAIATTGIGRARPLPDRTTKDKAVVECTNGNYPRYVPKKAPWKLDWSFNIAMRQRPQDVGCHYQHGPFSGKIRGWVTFSGQTVAMVGMQGWGFNLAANDNYLFYKWWFVAMMGMTPLQCMATLCVRRF
jgi:hypothetical protein